MSSTSSEATDAAALQRQLGRQALRAPLVTEWFQAAGLQPGDTVADLGCGPGYVSLRAAEHVGERGGVYAIDSCAEAIALLQHTAALHQLHHLHAMTAAVEDLHDLPGPVDAALLCMVLHHAPDPRALLAHVRSLLPEDARLLVAEFAPDGAGRIGPPLSTRLGPAHLRELAAFTGFETDLVEQQSTEHWFCVLTPR